MPAPATRVFDVASALLDAVVANHGGELPDRRYVSAGAPAWDCELVSTWCESTSGVDGGTTIDTLDAHTGSAGHTMRSGVFVVTIARCTPAIPDGRDFPTVANEETAAAALYEDAQRTLNALIEAERDGDLPGCHGIAFLGWSFVGPEGGFVAGELRVLVALSLG